MDDPLALVIGADGCALGRQAMASLCDSAETVLLSTPAAATEFLTRERRSPDLIVLVQAFDGQWDVAEIAVLRVAAPLPPIWRLLDSWCEGEQRTGRPPAGCVNVYAHQWDARIASELQPARAGSGLVASASLPSTVSADERILWQAEQPWPKCTGKVAIIAPSGESQQALTDVCRRAGFEAVVARTPFTGQPVDIVLWDCEVAEMGDPKCVGTLREQLGKAPIVAIVGFPRPEDTAAALDVGIASVVSKPYLIGDLLVTLGGPDNLLSGC